MSTLAYTPLLYGSEYLEKAIKSVQYNVDEHLILYTAEPSYSHKGNIPNPDTKQMLQDICAKFPHIKWVDIRANGEGEHRQQAFNYARQRNYDLVIAVDSDEVWEPKTVPKALKMAEMSHAYQYGVAGSQWITFWKSFDEYVQDGFEPIRLFNLNRPKGTQEILHDDETWIYHMGYCISDKLMKYKLSCHGHKSEIPTSWFQTKWKNYKKGETTHLHPVTMDYWIETKERDFEIPNILKI